MIDLKTTELLTEEGISANDLPRPIQQKLRMLRANIGRYEKTPSDVMKNAVIKNDIQICHEIQNWLDQDEEQAAEKNTNPTPPQNTPPAAPKEIEPANPAPIHKPNEVIVEQIRMNLVSRRISKAKLTEILGQAPHFPEHTVGDICLRRVFMNSNLYELK